MKQPINNRWTGKPIVEIEVADDSKTPFRDAVVRAVAEHASLGGAYLRGAYLGGAYLGGASLRGADLGGASLRGANLAGADLGGASLRGANLAGASLGGADLGGADLAGADLGGADLGGADLAGADLAGADLGGADLAGADLAGADLGGILTASVQWTGLGAEGRTWLVVHLPALVATDRWPAREAMTTYHCGCFSGTEAELRERIMSDGDDAEAQARYRASRLLALDFLSARMAEMLK